MENISGPSHQMVWELKHLIPMDEMWPPGDIKSTVLSHCTSTWVNLGGPNKNGRTSITSPTLSSLLTSLTTAKNVQYPSSKNGNLVGGMNGQTSTTST